MRIIAILAVLLLSLVASRASAEEPVRIGSKRFTESYVLAEITVRFAKDAGLAAVHEQGLGATAVTFRALEDGAIDAYVEYTGTLSEAVLHAPDGDVRRALDARGLAMSAPVGFENTYALAVRREVATRLSLRRLSDLGAHPELRFGLSHEFVGRSDGWPGLSEKYALAPRVMSALDHALAYEALARGDVDVLDVYTTDAKISRYDLAVLEDDRRFFPRYEAVLVYRKALLVRSPAFARVLGKLEGAIDAPTMQRLNARAELDGVPFARVAEDFVNKRTSAVGARAGFGASIVASIVTHGPRHVWLVVLALLASTLVGIPLGVLAYARPRVGALVLGITGIVQTIPSLALFCFFIPLFGIGVTPALAALALYGLLPIVRNTHAGLSSIPAELRESALALGLSGRERLWHVEIPLASRTIVAGVKTSAVVCVGSATIAAFIGAGGFGEPISTGLSLNDVRTILDGAIPAAALAVLVQALFAGIERLIVPRALRERDEPSEPTRA